MAIIAVRSGTQLDPHAVNQQESVVQKGRALDRERALDFRVWVFFFFGVVGERRWKGFGVLGFGGLGSFVFLEGEGSEGRTVGVFGRLYGFMFFFFSILRLKGFRG